MSALSRKIAFMLSDDLHALLSASLARVDEVLSGIEDREERQKIRDKIEVILTELSTNVAFKAFLRWKNVRDLEVENDTGEIIKDILSVDTRYKILMILENARVLSKKELGSLCGISSRKLNRHLKELMEMGFIRKGEKRGTVEFVTAPWENV